MTVYVAVYADGLGTFQARCMGCDWRGRWRRREETAVRDYADALVSLADALDEVEQATASWAEEEDREAKADARDALLDSLSDLVSVHDEVLAMDPLPDGIVS